MRSAKTIRITETDYFYDNDKEQVAVYPFAPLETYVCPLEILGQCKRSETFRDMKPCANHVHHTHLNRFIKIVDEDSIEDGNTKVPCPRKGGQMFAQYGPASYHARKACKIPAESLFPRAVPGATSELYALESRSMRGPRRRTLGRMFGTAGDHTNATCAAGIGETCVSSRDMSRDAKDLVVRGTQDHVTASSWKLRRASRPQ
jgi:hypothetical protein